MHRSNFATMAIAFISLIAASVASIAGGSADYSKRILGCWAGHRKFHVYHADSTWGVKRNEDAPEDSVGRGWRLDGDKLTLICPGDHGSLRRVEQLIAVRVRRTGVPIGAPEPPAGARHCDGRRWYHQVS